MCASGDMISSRGSCTARRVVAGCNPPGDRPCNSGSGSGYCPAARSDPPGDNAADCGLCLLLLRNDAILGSGDVVP